MPSQCFLHPEAAPYPSAPFPLFCRSRAEARVGAHWARGELEAQFAPFGALEEAVVLPRWAGGKGGGFGGSRAGEALL